MKTQKQKGQALVSLLAFVAIAIVTSTAAVTVAIITARSGDDFAQGNKALSLAQAGAENALVRLLRNEAFGGETITIDSDSTQVTVTGSSPKTITSVATVGNFKRIVEVTGTFNNNAFAITSWKEIN